MSINVAVATMELLCTHDEQGVVLVHGKVLTVGPILTFHRSYVCRIVGGRTMKAHKDYIDEDAYPEVHPFAI